MKFTAPDNRRALSILRPVLVLAAVALVPLLLYGSAPSWWSQRGVLVENVAPDDHSPVNQGQLKNIAKAAVAEMDSKLPGGAGEQLHSLVESWSAHGGDTNDYAPVNIGQLKTVAKPFYDRLIALGIVDFYPWLTSSNSPDDFAVANIGQVKSLFAFEVPTSNIDGQSVAFNPLDIDESGIVVGSAGADMVVSSSPLPQNTISGASPLAINDHTYPAPSPVAQTSAAANPPPQPSPTPCGL